MYPHRIRLRGPWDVEASDGSARSVKFPIRWADLGAATVLRRSFGSPSRIDAHERVWLIGEGLAGPVEASLNARLLGGVGDRETFGVDVTKLLGARNRLELRLGSATREVETAIDVALEVRASAWLESLRLSGSWLEGRVVGESAEPLEIHVVAERRGCGDQTTTASDVGTPFRVRLDREVDAVRVELIHVSSIWWAADVEQAGDEALRIPGSA